MDTIAVVVGGIGGAACGALLGVLLGKWCAKRATWWFWTIAFSIAIAGIAVSFMGLQSETDMVFVGGVAFIAGGLTALKYAAGRIPGMGGEA